MNYIEEIQKGVQSIQVGLGDLVDIAMHENEKQIREWITDRWLTGKTPLGDYIGVYRGQGYAELKNRLNSKAGLGNVDLTLTGALGRGIQISGFNDEYEIFSTDWKYNDIVAKYGEINFNISEDEREILFSKIILIVLTELNNAYE